MIHHGEVKGLPLIAFRATKAVIEALDAVEGMTAFATDTKLWGYFDGTDWAWGGSSPIGLDDLTDVNAPSPNDEDVLSWDETAGKWVPVPPGGGSFALDDLTDVNAPSPDDEDVLTWDETSGKWVPAPGGGGGGMTNPMTGAGDIIIGGGEGTPTRLAPNIDGQVLTLVGGVPTWADPTGGEMFFAVTQLVVDSYAVSLEESSVEV